MRNAIYHFENMINEIELKYDPSNIPIHVSYRVALLGIEATDNINIDIVEINDEKFLNISASSYDGKILYNDILIQIKFNLDYSSCKYDIRGGILYINFNIYNGKKMKIEYTILGGDSK